MIYRFAATLLFAGLIPLQCYARDYHIEAIIFTNTVAADREIVAWDDKAPRNIRALNKLDRLYRNAVEATEAREKALLETRTLTATQSESVALTQPGDETSTKQQVIKTEISFELVELLELQKVLEESSDHTIIKTLSWNQSEADYKTSPLINTLTPHMKGVIRVYAPNLLFAEVNLSYVPDEIFPESLNTSNEKADIEVESVMQAPPATELSTISVNTQSELQPQAEPIVAHYFMDEQRKLKLNEIHYFDHPNFGVILTVKPIDELASQ